MKKTETAEWAKAYFTAKNITLIASMSAVSTVLYYFVKFALPIFPFFLELQVSDLPALITGYIAGPLGGAIVIVVRTLLKLFGTSTACVGELADLIIGLAFVLPAAHIYKQKKYHNLGGAFVGLVVGVFSTTGVAIFCNWAFLVRFYSLYFPGGFPAILSVVQGLFPMATEQNFYVYYLFCAVLPFNMLRSVLCATLTFALFKAVGISLERIYRGRSGSRVLAGSGENVQEEGGEELPQATTLDDGNGVES